MNDSDATSHGSEEFREMDRQLWEVFRPLENMPDALAVIRAAAYVDDALKLLLVGQFRASKISLELLRGPIRSFAAKAKLAFALGRVSEDDLQDIDTIRDLRNRCAHTFNDVDLSTRPFCDLTRSLRAWRFWTEKADLGKREKDAAESKARFLLTAGVLAEDIVSPLGATRTLDEEESREFWRGVFRIEEGEE